MSHYLVEFDSDETCENRDVTFLLVTRLLCHVTIIVGDPFS